MGGLFGGGGGGGGGVKGMLAPLSNLPTPMNGFCCFQRLMNYREAEKYTVYVVTYLST